MKQPYVVELKDALKTFTLDQDKTMFPEETVRRFRERIAPLNLRILEETRRIDNGRLDIPVFFSVCGHDARAVTGTNKQMGKGATPAQAEASAVMELAERFSFFSFRDNPDNFRIDTYANVRDDAIPFEWIARSVHDSSADLDAARLVFSDLKLHWTRAFNLIRGKPMLVPFDWFYAINEFNGPSAGNCVEEAISQGVCEIVERHVSALVADRRPDVPAIDPDSSTDPMVREMLEKYRRNGIRLHVSDFTLGMGIPTVGVLAYDPSTFPHLSEIVWTAGTSPDPDKALSRALTETAQLAGDFNTGANYVASGLPKFRRLEDAGFIMNPSKQIPISGLPDLAHDNIRVEVERLTRALADRDFQVLLIDTMHPGLQIPAFYTIIPGAHFRERSRGTSVGMFTARLMLEKMPPPMALRRIERMEAILPGKYYTAFYRGLCHVNMDESEEALRCFDQALDRNPDVEERPTIYSYMGVCLKDMEQYRQALGVLEKGVELDSERTDLFNLMGFCRFKLKEHPEAIDCFQKVVRLNPGSAIDYANIASNYRDMGEVVKAIEYYEAALEIDPGIDFARDNLKKLKGS